jgi:5-methyltetrahydropteroyltriglutamate--homocysteine methyltransferase
MTPTRPPLGTTVLGYPRIGPRRELKRLLERYWAGYLDRELLLDEAAILRARTWTTLRGAGLPSIPSNIFSLYDHVLDAAVAVDAVPERYRSLGLSGPDTYFAMARGALDVPAMEMTKWFDTNYHCIVPEIGPETPFAAVPDKLVQEHAEALALGIDTRPVLVGPVTLLLLSKPAPGSPAGFVPLDRLDDLIAVYAILLERLFEAGASWVQLDEPAFVQDRSPAELSALRRAYENLGGSSTRPGLFVASYFGDLQEALPVLLSCPVEAVGVDLVSAPESLERTAACGPIRDRTVVAGLVDGRNVWRTDLRRAAATAGTLLGLADSVEVSTSCSLLHVPVDLDAETDLDPLLRARLAFARQKVDEVVALGAALREGATDRLSSWEPLPASWTDARVRARLEALAPEHARREPYGERASRQHDRLGLPALPTTTIGSFPQTGGVRAARTAFRTGRTDRAQYNERMRSEIAKVIALQEKLGLDVLVHGEPERNDMVQYFAENLDGFAATRQGWVQSYGSRCVRPPILYGDVARPVPFTIEWITYAQSLTERPVKGMVTGPVTILAWSFVRQDQPLEQTARQIALALRDEIHDLEAAGITVIQVDEPALRELLPPRRRDHPGYLDWAVSAFHLATSGVSPATQIHTHLCYSEFGQVLSAIDALDADVTSIEASRSKMEILDDLREAGFVRGIGPGVYDIHSPRVPSTREMAEALQAALKVLPADRLWGNPDCGLKTRTWEEVEASLANMVRAAHEVRSSLS